MGPPRWAEPFVAVPYRDGGRDFAGADCWGLVRLVMRERGGVSLPSYGEIAASERARVARRMTKDSDGGPWLPVDAPRALDVVVMFADAKVGGRFRRLRGHVGIMVDDRHVLHTEEETGASIARITADDVRHRIACFRRHEALA